MSPAEKNKLKTWLHFIIFLIKTVKKLNIRMFVFFYTRTFIKVYFTGFSAFLIETL